MELKFAKQASDCTMKKFNGQNCTNKKSAHMYMHTNIAKIWKIERRKKLKPNAAQ